MGTELSTTEQQLVPALEWLQAGTATAVAKVRVLFAAILTSEAAANRAALDRLGLDRASGIGDRLMRKLVNYALNRTGQ